MPAFNFAYTLLIVIGMSACNGLPMFSNDRVQEEYYDVNNVPKAGVDDRGNPNEDDHIEHPALLNTDSPTRQQLDNDKVAPVSKNGDIYITVSDKQTGYATKATVLDAHGAPLLRRFRISDLIGHPSLASRMNTLLLPQSGQRQHSRHRRCAHKTRHAFSRAKRHNYRERRRNFHRFWFDSLDSLGSGLIGK